MVDGIGIPEKFNERRGPESKTNNNRLFIWLVVQLGGGLCKKNAVFNNYHLLSELENNGFMGFTMRMLPKNLNGCDESLKLYQKPKSGTQILRQ